MTGIRIFVTIVLLVPGAHDASRYTEMEEEASSTDNICVLTEKEGVWQYGIALHYKIDGECSAETCNPLRVLCENGELVTQAVHQDGKCVCEVNNKPVFEIDSENEQFEITETECNAEECWSSYLELLNTKMEAAKELAEKVANGNKIQFDRGASFEEHWHAECKSLQSNPETDVESQSVTPQMIPTLADVATEVQIVPRATERLRERFGDEYDKVLFPPDLDPEEVKLVAKKDKEITFEKQKSISKPLEFKTDPQKNAETSDNKKNTNKLMADIQPMGNNEEVNEQKQVECNEGKLLYSEQCILEPQGQDNKKGWMESVKDCDSLHYMLRIGGKKLIGIHLGVVDTKSESIHTQKKDLEIWYVETGDNPQWQVYFNRNVEPGDEFIDPSPSRSTLSNIAIGIFSVFTGNSPGYPEGCCFDITLNGYKDERPNNEFMRPYGQTWLKSDGTGLKTAGTLEMLTKLDLTFITDNRAKTQYNAPPKAVSGGSREKIEERVGHFTRLPIPKDKCMWTDHYGGTDNLNMNPFMKRKKGGPAFLEQSSSP